MLTGIPGYRRVSGLLRGRLLDADGMGHLVVSGHELCSWSGIIGGLVMYFGGHPLGEDRY